MMVPLRTQCDVGVLSVGGRRVKLSHAPLLLALATAELYNPYSELPLDPTDVREPKSLKFKFWVAGVAMGNTAYDRLSITS